jgi:hypothetical protein
MSAALRSHGLPDALFSAPAESLVARLASTSVCAASLQNLAGKADE